jgi:hypothetical protein
VIICRPSESVPQNQAMAWCGLGMGAYQGCARIMSIAVQKLDAEFAGAVPRVHVKVSGKGHGRGNVCGPPLRLFWTVIRHMRAVSVGHGLVIGPVNCVSSL